MTNEEYTRKVLPFLKIKYFEGKEHQIVYDEIEKFVDKYSELPTKEAITIQLEKRTDLNEEAWKTTQNLVDGLTYEKTDQKWLVDTTEQYCKDRALHLAVLDGINIIGGMIRTGLLMLYLTSCLMLFLLVSICLLVMIILITLKIGINSITQKSKRFPLT